MQRAKTAGLAFLLTLGVVWIPWVVWFAIQTYLLGHSDPKFGQDGGFAFGVFLRGITAGVSAAVVAATHLIEMSRSNPLGFWNALIQPFGWISLVAVPFAVWVAFDSRRIRIRDYHSSLAYSPGALFLLTPCAWIVVFPWYLTVRDLIKTGRALRRASSPTGSSTSA